MTFLDDVSKSPLGKQNDGPLSYSPDILVAITRQTVANDMGVPCFGCDVWTAYEFYYLNSVKIPQIRRLTLRIDSQSSHIVESKSLKLYLNTYYQLVFSSDQECINQIQSDLQTLLNQDLDIKLQAYEKSEILRIPDNYICLENDIVALSDKALFVEDRQVQETLYTDTFRSLCPVTSQPDFATIIISYKGQAINKAALLSYLLSFSDHQGFHEQCIEEIYATIYQISAFSELKVQGLFTRRGGIDINPFRSNAKSEPLFFRHSRQ